ncbi:hypothetical protein K443DRAFT_6605 [Laccaria amethystina LaAM-08-1]|uniref:Uncharacterized protein n=1 Tax=Laccaria amethystina LaAM-08-1 TaxID=1095629 RepID=A0A0C9XJY4_9AGAR|nr:hypothetical protein K443DRAFT_6605 [Laccaria amethystina LaAM-08-1]
MDLVFLGGGIHRPLRVCVQAPREMLRLNHPILQDLADISARARLKKSESVGVVRLVDRASMICAKLQFVEWFAVLVENWASSSQSLVLGLSIVNILQTGLVSVNVLAEPIAATVDVAGSGPFKVTVNVVSASAGLEQPAHVPHAQHSCYER